MRCELIRVLLRRNVDGSGGVLVYRGASLPYIARLSAPFRLLLISAF